MINYTQSLCYGWGSHGNYSACLGELLLGLSRLKFDRKEILRYIEFYI